MENMLNFGINKRHITRWSNDTMKIIKNNMKLLSLIVKNVPFYLIITIVDNIFLGVINSYASVYFIKIFIDRIVSNVPISDVLSLIGKFFVAYLFGYLFHVWYLYIFKPKSEHLIHKKIQGILLKKASQIKMECYDDPEYFNDFIWSMNEADRETTSLIDDLGLLCNRITSVGTIVVVLGAINKVILLLIVFCVIVSLIFKMINTKQTYKKDCSMQNVHRKLDYIDRVYYLKEYAEDVRKTNITFLLDRKFKDCIKEKRKLVKEHGMKLSVLGLASDVSSSTIFNIGVWLLLIYEIQIKQTISPGDFAACASSCWRLFWQINSILNVVTSMQRRNLYIKRVFEFLNNKKCTTLNVKEGRAPEFKNVISFRNVSFRYPGNKKDTISNVTFDINIGEKIVLVGSNGAGKTTLVKLLLRLYEPTDGFILLDGKDIRDIPINDYRLLFGTVFQDFQMYALSVAENVLMDVFECEKEKVVLSALKFSNFNKLINTYESGISTVVTKEFSKDGLELSKGEQQKLAISRILVDKRKIAVLDEPSSSLDAASEDEVNRFFLSEHMPETIVFISHRLSSATVADKIIVLEKGEIVEQGTHSQLINNNNIYAKLFKTQAKKFKI